jgi:histidinol-phosphate aminotransferase
MFGSALWLLGSGLSRKRIVMPGRFRKNISALAGYVPGEQPEDGAYIKLNTNENPYPPSPRVVAALKKAAGRSLRLYPEPMSREVRDLAASIYGVTPENVLVGNGSDEVLSILVRAFVGAGDRVLYPEPTYTLYDTLVAIQEGVKVSLPYTADFLLPEAFFSETAALTFVCNPNSPSATLLPLDVIERLVRNSSGAVVVDEAYIDFADRAGVSAIPLIKNYSNLIVLRTFSKSFSLAGMRVGLAFAGAELIDGMMKIKDSYNINRLSQTAAAAALGDLPWMERNVQRIQRSRKKLVGGLKKLGFMVYPPQANFVLARREGQNLRGLYEELKRRKILVRYFAQPGLEDCLRITVGAPDEVAALLDQLAAIIKG